MSSSTPSTSTLPPKSSKNIAPSSSRQSTQSSTTLKQTITSARNETPSKQLTLSKQHIPNKQLTLSHQQNPSRRQLTPNQQQNPSRQQIPSNQQTPAKQQTPRLDNRQTPKYCIPTSRIRTRSCSSISSSPVVPSAAKKKKSKPQPKLVKTAGNLGASKLAQKKTDVVKKGVTRKNTEEIEGNVKKQRVDTVNLSR